MRRFDLGMSINYCPLWGVVEAIREFFQNAFDSETENSNNTMYFSYDEENEILRVGNKNGVLATDTLLLGKTSKLGNDKMIGQHGEGYKVATVVLLRNGKSVKVFNRGLKEVWTAKIIKSRRYQADVVVFDIEKVSIFKSVPDHDLIFEVGGITKEEYNAIKESNLHIQNLVEFEDFIKSGDSKILINEHHRGKLFVGGLYVTTSKYAQYGYDFDPRLVKLDRDRSFIDGIDLQFLCAKVISATNNVDFIIQMKDIWDGYYLRLFLCTYCHSDCSKLFDESFEEFKSKNGKDAIPTNDIAEFNRLKRNGLNAILVSENDYNFITSSSKYSEPEISFVLSSSELADQLETWFNTYIENDSDAYNEGKELISSIVDRLKNN